MANDATEGLIWSYGFEFFFAFDAVHITLLSVELIDITPHSAGYFIQYFKN